MRILLYTSSPTRSNGYARIGNMISNFLAEQGHRVWYFAIASSKDEEVKRAIHPAIQFIEPDPSLDPFGVSMLYESIQCINADIVFLYGDLYTMNWLFTEVFENRPKRFQCIIYLDLVYKYQKLSWIHTIDSWSDGIFVFDQYWKQHLIKLGVNESKLFVFPHGFDDKTFYPIPQNEARKTIQCHEDDILFLNSNRNSYRKAHDITLEGFIKCVKKNNMNPRLRLLLHGTYGVDYHFKELVIILCREQNLTTEETMKIRTHHILRSATKAVSDDIQNLLYNACNVGVNTALGEGFGLCNVEHAGIGKPQIVPRIGAFQNIFNDETSTFVEPVTKLYMVDSLLGHNGFIEICSSEDVANAMDRYIHDPDLAKIHGEKARNDILSRFHWNDLLHRFHLDLMTIIQ